MAKVGGTAAHTCAEARPQPDKVSCEPKTAPEQGVKQTYNELTVNSNDEVTRTSGAEWSFEVIIGPFSFESTTKER